MKCKLNPRLSSGDWNEFCERFHFPMTDVSYIKAIYMAMLPLIDAYAFYSMEQNLEEITLPHYVYGMVTLGTGMDEMADLYLNHEQIQEAYIIDCISLMLLSKAYEEFAYVIEEQSSLYLTELSFLGDQYSLELLPQIYEQLAPDDIILTEGNMLKPLKTATLILQLDAHQHTNVKQLCNTCANCKNFSCPSRKVQASPMPKTYGNMQIFHKNYANEKINSEGTVMSP